MASRFFTRCLKIFYGIINRHLNTNVLGKPLYLAEITKCIHMRLDFTKLFWDKLQFGSLKYLRDG